jgi:Mg-chelatase subunit ChlD
MAAAVTIRLSMKLRSTTGSGKIAMVIAAAVIVTVILSPALSAGPFIKIVDVDYKSGFPLVRVAALVKMPELLAPEAVDDNIVAVYEDGFRVNSIKVEETAKHEGSRFALCIDSSRSLRETDLYRIKKLAREFIEASRSSDSFALYRFNDHVKLLASFASGRSELNESLNRITRKGSRTLLLNSIYDSVELLSETPAAHRAVVVFTDGRDEGSVVNDDDVVKFSREHSIPLYAVCLGSSARCRSLARVSTLTGGGSIRVRRNGGEHIYEYIKNARPVKIEVTFKSGLAPDRKAHLVELRFRHGSYRDSDTREITAARPLGVMEIPSSLQLLLVLLVALLLGLMALCGAHVLRQRKRLRGDGAAPLPAYTKAMTEFGRLFEADEQSKIAAQRTITPEDPEYVYSRAWLVQRSGPEAGKKFPIFWEEITLGRDGENAIVVRDGAVSLRHAKIKDIKGAYFLFDLVSDNGTYLNDKKLLRPKALYDWDEIRIGRTLFIFRGSKIA